MNIALVGGTTGGHIIPLIRLRKYLLSKNEPLVFYYFGVRDSLEEKICKLERIKFYPISFVSINSFFKDYKQVGSLFESLKIDKVISTGGKVSFYPLFYARNHKLPYFLIEENKVIGLTNNFFKRHAQTLFSNFPIKYEKAVLAINPSSYFLKEVKNKKYDFLIIGGSKGSRPLCELGIKLAKKKVKVCLIAGNYYSSYKKFEDDNLKVLEFENNIISFIAQSEIIISRAGSSTIFEVIKMNKKYIVIPSKNTKKDHQVLNANYLAEQNLAIVFDEDTVKSEDIIKLYQSENVFYHQLESQRAFINLNSMKKYEVIL